MAKKICMVALSPTMESGHIVLWKKQEGDVVKVGDILCEVETDKAVMDYESDDEGVLLKILKSKGEKALLGDVIAIVGERGEDIVNLELPESVNETMGNVDSDEKKSFSELMSVEREQSDISSKRKKISPLARVLIKERGLNLDFLQGTGPGGRIVRRDVEKLSKENSFGIPKTANVLHPSSKKIPLSNQRKVIAQRMSESKFSAPHFYLKKTICMDRLLQFRRVSNETLKNPQERLSLNAFLIFFVARALRLHPRINSMWRDTFIEERNASDIGLAVAQKGGGLIVPVIRSAETKGIVQIDTELKDCVARAQGSRLTPEEYSNAGFTISNLGSFGVDEFTAIVNPPGSAILAVGSIQKMVVVLQDGSFGVQEQLILTLSCDHRVVDGVEGAKFLLDLKNILEDPSKALL